MAKKINYSKMKTHKWLMDPYKFYELTMKMFNEYCDLINISPKERKRYFSPTDFDDEYIFKKILGLNDENSIQFVFAQICFHARNGGFALNNIVPFDAIHKNALIKAFANFNPQSFLDKYVKFEDEKDNDKNAKYASQEFYNLGFKWDLDKTKQVKIEEQPIQAQFNYDSSISKYLKGILNAAEYLQKCVNRSDFISKLIATNKTKKEIIEYFRTTITGSGYGVALTCDLLKELSPKFDSFCKPDTHILQVMCKLTGQKENGTDQLKYLTIDAFDALVNEINNELDKKKEKRITAYQLDRIIYMVTSGKFFLHDIDGINDYYLQSIK